MKITAHLLFGLLFSFVLLLPTSVLATESTDTPVAPHFPTGMICVNGDYAYILDGRDGGLHIFDISDPLNPSWINTVKWGGDWQVDVEVAGDYAYVSDYGMLVVISVNPPASAHVVNTIEIEGSTWGIDIASDYLYLADMDFGLYIIDIADPLNAEIVGEVPMERDGEYVDYDNGYAYVSEYEGGLVIVDVDPISDAHVVTTYLPTEFGDCDYVSVSDGYAFIAAYWEGFEIVDVDPPEDVHSVQLFPTFDQTHSIIYDGYFLVTNEKGLQIIDIGDPENASIVKTVPIDGRAGMIDAQDGYVFMSDPGLTVIDIDPIEEASVVATIDSLE
jgi:hypothetical protein